MNNMGTMLRDGRIKRMRKKLVEEVMIASAAAKPGRGVHGALQKGQSGPR
jgi:hypothetical protein